MICINYYNKIIDNEIYSKERHKVITYFEIDKLLNEVGKKYNRRILFRMKQFYNVFSNEKSVHIVDIIKV